MIKDSYKDSGITFDKNIHPSETLKWIKKYFHSFSPPLLKDCERIDKGRLGIPVYASRYTPYASKITGSLKQMGKGGSPEQAETSAVMELIERFSVFSFFKTRGKKLFSLKELRGKAIPFEEILKSVNGLEMPEHEKDSALRLLNIIPLDWTRAYDPYLKKECWLPWSWFWKINEYNGSAAGNSFEEASVQALCEVVERHVCSIISHQKMPIPGIDPMSVKDPEAQKLLKKFNNKGVKFILKDFSLGLRVPTVGIIAWDPATFPEKSEIVYTAGTSPDPERALIRAITEVAQLAGDFDTEGSYLESGLPKISSLEESEHIMESPSIVAIQALPCCGSDNFKVEIENICDALNKRSLNGYLIDITHPELLIPAAYAVIPGNQFRDRTRNIDFVSHCARLVAELNENVQALSILEQMKQLYPSSKEVLFYQGYIHEQLENFPAALNVFKKSLALVPSPLDMANLHCHMGLCYKEMDEIDLALKELRTSLKLNPDLKEAHNLSGYCHYKKGDHVSAIEAFEQAISIDPYSAIDYANIAVNLRSITGMDEIARKWYEMALELDPGITWAKEHLEQLNSK